MNCRMKSFYNRLQCKNVKMNPQKNIFIFFVFP